MVRSIKQSLTGLSRSCVALLALHVCFGGSATLAQSRLYPQSLSTVGVHALKALDPNLTGQGVHFAVVSRAETYLDGVSENDYRPNLDHRSLAHNQILSHDDASSGTAVSFHSTAVCSILFGRDAEGYQDTLGAFHYQGIAPAAQADVYELYYFMGEVVWHQKAESLDIISASCGWDLEDWYTRGIEALVEHQGLIAVASIGNGADAYHAPLYPGASANAIGVGVVDSVASDSLATMITHFGLARPEHSSCGPTGDGRSKPDLVAPGNCLVASDADPDAYDVTGNASSFAAPVVAGVAGLLVQKAKQDPSLLPALAPQAGGCVIKALLMNSATKLPFWHKGELGLEDDHSVPLDYAQGAGMVNGLEAYRHLTAGRQTPGSVAARGWDLNELNSVNQASHIYSLSVSEPNEDFITATLVWNRHYESVFPFQRRGIQDQDLALELWAVDPNDTSKSVRIDYSDSLDDNVEHLHTRSLPSITEYQLVVLLKEPLLSEGPALEQPAAAWERYALAWNGTTRLDESDIRWHDLNSDGIVDAADVRLLEEIVANEYPARQNAYLIGDVNTDGEIDIADIEAIEAHESRRAAWYTGFTPIDP